MKPTTADRSPRAERPGPTEPRAAEAPTAEAPTFERPQVRRLGSLPAVTTAFGGSFTP